MLTPWRNRHYTALRPLAASVRSAGRLRHTGSDALLADAGQGLAHVPMTIAEFREAAPLLLGITSPTADAEERIAAWRARGGAAFGEERPPRTGALLSVAVQPMGIEGIGFGVVKLLHQQLRGVHLRVYSNVFPERPVRVDEALLLSRPVKPDRMSERPLDEPLAIGHLPLGYAAFQVWQPEFIAMALVDPDELLGYDQWRLAEGGFF